MNSLIRWSPVPWLSEDLEKMIDRFGTAGMTGFVPAIDIYQTKDEVIIEASLPGIDPENVEVAVEQDVLTIQGKSQKKTEVEEKNYYLHEVRHGSFHRSIALPAAVEGDKAEAIYREGILNIKIPKAPEIKPKTIKIKTNSKEV